MAITMPRNVKPANTDKRVEAFISGAGLSSPPVASTGRPEAGKVVVNMRFDSALLQRIDAEAKRLGISRTAWLHVAASLALE
jgi:hypothetical protein